MQYHGESREVASLRVRMPRDRQSPSRLPMAFHTNPCVHAYLDCVFVRRREIWTRGKRKGLPIITEIKSLRTSQT